MKGSILVVASYYIASVHLRFFFLFGSGCFSVCVIVGILRAVVSKDMDDTLRNVMQHMDSSALQRTLHGGETPASKRIKTTTDTMSFVTPRYCSQDDDNNDNVATPEAVSLPTPLSKVDAQELFEKETKSSSVSSDETKTTKRVDYLSWDDYFFAVVLLSAMRSKDPTSPTGACIVNDENRIVAIGYNGFPRTCSDDVLPWQLHDNKKWLHTREPYECHAEINAILNKCSANVKGTRLYAEHYPCNECAKVILQSGIKEVVYLKNEFAEKDEYMASRILLEMAGVQTRSYTPTIDSVVLNFVESMAPTSGQAVTQELKGKPESPERMQFYKNLLSTEVGSDYDMSKAPSMKRQDYLSWDDYFMAIAFLTAQRSKDPNTQVGACIVDSHKRIVGVGYNGFPRGCSDDVLPWSRCSAKSKLLTKYMYVCHAEVNAILNKCSTHVEGSTLYVALFPCNNCAKLIIQSGIREVVYLSDQYHDTETVRASRVMFAMANITTRQYIPSKQVLEIVLRQDKDNDTE